MKMLCQISLILFIMLSNLGNNSTTQFCNEKNSVTIKMGKQCDKIRKRLCKLAIARRLRLL